MPDAPFHLLRGRSPSPVVLTCDHASERLPDPWIWPAGDRRLAGTHWAFDPGAADLTAELSAVTGYPSVLSNFSRLLVDPNRPTDSPTLFRSVAEHAPVLLNADVEPVDRSSRLSGFYHPYHDAIERVIRAANPHLLFAVHTFTPVYEGTERDVAVGVLFDHDEGPAELLARALSRSGLVTRRNEPWSGKDGLMYAAEHHARPHGIVALELELRQDLATDPRFRAWFVPRLVASIDEMRAAW